MGKTNSVKLETGTVYQPSKGGNYHFRYQVNHERKCVSLKTKNLEEAIQKAKEFQPIVNASSVEVISAHVKVAKSLVKQVKSIPAHSIWDNYCKHPDRATPATVNEELSYKATLIRLLEINPQIKEIKDVTPQIANEFAEHLKSQELAVDTHNRRIKQLQKIFSTLKEFIEENPFASPTLRRKAREEQGNSVRRLAFSKEQVELIKEALDTPIHRLLNKDEIKVIFYIGMYTGQRLKDCVLLQWQNIDLEQQRIWVKQFKTGKEVSIPIAPQLQSVLLEAFNLKINQYVSPNVAKRYLKTDKQGKNVGENAVNVDVMRVIKWTGVESSIAVAGRKRKVTVYGFHSLRHSFASHCAEAGIPKAVVTSILGANSEIIDRFYTHVGEEAQRAAIDAIAGASQASAPHKVNMALQYISSLQNKSKEIDEIERILTE